MKQKTSFPWLLLIIGVGFIALTAWSLYQAGRGTSDVTDRDYYSHGLRYNETLLEEKAAAALGWSARVSLEQRTLSVLVHDKQGRLIDQARASLTLFNSPEFQKRPFPLQEHRPGFYQLRLPDTLHGEFSVEISFERDGARLNKRLLLALD